MQTMPHYVWGVFFFKQGLPIFPQGTDSMGCLRLDQIFPLPLFNRLGETMAKRKMAKKKVAARRGVPTPEVIRDCREAREVPQYLLCTYPSEQYDSEEDNDDDDCDEYYHDWLYDNMDRRGYFKTEEEAIEAAKKNLNKNRYEQAFCVMKITRVIKARVADPVIEVL